MAGMLDGRETDYQTQKDGGGERERDEINEIAHSNISIGRIFTNIHNFAQLAIAVREFNLQNCDFWVLGTNVQSIYIYIFFT